MTNEEIMDDQKKRDEVVVKMREKYPNVDFPDPVLEPIYFGRLSKTAVENRKLVLDKRNGNQFDIVSDSYKLLYHEEVLDNILNSIPEEFGDPLISTTLFKGGARSLFTIGFPGMPDWDINGHKGKVEFMLRNSYDRSSYLSYSQKVTEEICTNGLVGLREQSSGAAKHLKSTISKFDLAEKMRDGLEILSHSKELWVSWMEKKVSELQIKEVVEALPYSENEAEALMDLKLLNKGGVTLNSLKDKATLWDVNSAATQFVHEIKSEERKLDIEHKVPAIIQHFNNKLAA